MKEIEAIPEWAARSLLAMAAEWDRESGPGYRHPHSIQVRDLLAGGCDAA